MDFDLANVLKVIGPAASLIFAAWIFVGFLQTRYDAAVERYRDIIEKYRTADLSGSRKANMTDQVVHYKRRCELMSRAIGCGLVSAILLIFTLIFGGLALTIQEVSIFKYISAGTATLGLLLVVVGTFIVIMEGRIIYRQMHSELLDIPDLAESIGQKPGSINDPQRHGQGTQRDRR
jgi:Ca2+/Na+ antiporter